ncbi:acyltransferase domain-containing protein [Streptomyces sp. NPDC037389]|uniref:acyltransferase domain-containing protein n=1 Tax=Streptomyces sp. NPDC037389 TaxID=3155369 RepID=UPI0033FF3A4F
MTATTTGGLPVALLLPGQGSQHPRMATGLYSGEAAEPEFAAAMDEVFTAMGAAGKPLRADWFAERPTVPVDHVTRSQPLIFAVDYALARLVMSRGVRPAALLGHSVGEMAAAVLAGVFTLPDATALVLDRVRRLADAPPGGMLAVAAAPGELEPYLGDDVVVGAVNAPRQTVLAGPEAPLEKTGQALRDALFTCRRVPSLTGFHSPMLEPACRGAEELFASVPVRAPRITIHSAYTAGPLTHGDVANPAYWARHPVAPVLFWPALDALLSTGDHILIETGPGDGLSRLARRHPRVRAGTSKVLPLRATEHGP